MPSTKRYRTNNLCGPVIAKLRKVHRISQEELRARCRTAGWLVSRPVLAKIETERRAVKDFELVALAKALRVDIADLVRQR